MSSIILIFGKAGQEENVTLRVMAHHTVPCKNCSTDLVDFFTYLAFKFVKSNNWISKKFVSIPSLEFNNDASSGKSWERVPYFLLIVIVECKTWKKVCWCVQFSMYLQVNQSGAFAGKPIWRPVFIFTAQVSPKVPVNAFERRCWMTSNK